MTRDQVEELATRGLFRHRPVNGHVEETHISWVVLGDKNAFKIKKPLKFPFLDFSTVSRRKYFCKREIELNGRFTDIYKDVVPIRKNRGRWSFGEGEGRKYDYAVRMKRLMTAKRLDLLLRGGTVQKERIRALAIKIAKFHSRARKIDTPFNIKIARNTFNDIGLMGDLVLKEFGAASKRDIDQAIHWSNDFLSDHASRLRMRVKLGFQRDVHGDLHSGNIFLYRNPILFDCIEFNDQFRQIDVLYELAFICMDFEFFGMEHLTKVFMKAYQEIIQCIGGKDDERILIYFKCLRANVRAKVHAMSILQHSDRDEAKIHLPEVSKYLSLMKWYQGKVN